MDTQQSGGAAAFIDVLRTMKQYSDVKKLRSTWCALCGGTLYYCVITKNDIPRTFTKRIFGNKCPRLARVTHKHSGPIVTYRHSLRRSRVIPGTSSARRELETNTSF